MGILSLLAGFAAYMVIAGLLWLGGQPPTWGYLAAIGAPLCGVLTFGLLYRFAPRNPAFAKPRASPELTSWRLYVGLYAAMVPLYTFMDLGNKAIKGKSPSLLGSLGRALLMTIMIVIWVRVMEVHKYRKALQAQRDALPAPPLHLGNRSPAASLDPPRFEV